MDSDQELRSLRRGLQALALINQAGQLSIAKAAELLKLPRTTAERILNTLAADGFLARSESDKLYRLTPKVKALSSGFSGDTWVTHVATPLLNQLTEEIGWPLAIASAEGADMHVRYTTDTMTSLWLNRRRVGSSIPIPRASSGTVHLAFASAAERCELELLVAQTYPDIPLDPAQIEAARQSGYAFSPQDTREQSISLPIFFDGKVTAVLLMIFMARVHHREVVLERYLERLVALARAIGSEASHAAHAPDGATMVGSRHDGDSSVTTSGA